MAWVGATLTCLRRPIRSLALRSGDGRLYWGARLPFPESWIGRGYGCWGEDVTLGPDAAVEITGSGGVR